MLYVDVAKTFSAEELWLDSKSYFWAEGLKTIDKLTFEEFEKCIWYLKDTSDHGILEMQEINDFFWFEDEIIEEIIGRKIWED